MPADRITLLYRKKFSQKGLTLFAFTPGTSFNLTNTVGNVEERLYLAWLCKRIFGLGARQRRRIFAQSVLLENFVARYRALSRDPELRLPPSEVYCALKKTWRQSQLPTGERVANAIHRAGLTKMECAQIVKRLRKQLAEAVMENLRPDLIVLDEFQRFRELIEADEGGNLKHPLASRLLLPQTPTLLLSATPYEAWETSETSFRFAGEYIGHQDSLKETFAFLYGDRRKADRLVAELADYGNRLLSLRDGEVESLIALKADIEARVKEVMSRTERNYFADRNEIEPHFLSDDGALLPSVSELREFFSVAEHVHGRKVFLSYWKSGGYPLSYMRDYDVLRAGWRKLRGSKELFTKLNGAPPEHTKLKYVFNDVLREHEAWKYLWVPPVRPYYKGAGIFAPTALAANPIKKGLVFSSWKFVPRFVAAELSAFGQRGQKRRKIVHPLKATTVTWARFYLPSRELAECVRHVDFAGTASYDHLLALARKNITQLIESRGGKVIGRGKPSPTWDVLKTLEFGDRLTEWHEVVRTYKRKHSRSGARAGAPFAKKEIAQLGADVTLLRDLSISRRTVNELATIALSSPSVSICRALMELVENTPIRHDWMELARLCAYELRNYLNRPLVFRAITKACQGSKRRGGYADRVARYFVEGNFQAVIDEYVFLINVGKGSRAFVEATRILQTVFAPRRGRVVVPVFGKRRPRRISTDVVAAFGEGAVQGDSREAVRTAFNSPFWPFLLVTTSVGQEGLDFHLYCKDIYHWNLPSNPVAFEQREGRINRYNNCMIRSNLVSTLGKLAITPGEFIWEKYFAVGEQCAHRNDRYSLGLSPHWIFTPAATGCAEPFRRHVLDLPCSGDRERYLALIRSLNLYRLALGQPDQKGFLEELKRNPVIAKVDPRGLILNFFPHQKVHSRHLLEAVTQDSARVEVVLRDALAYLKELETAGPRKTLRVQVERNISLVRRDLMARVRRRKTLLSVKARTALRALFYFLNPRDTVDDRSPEVGLNDDLKILKAS